MLKMILPATHNTQWPTHIHPYIYIYIYTLMLIIVPHSSLSVNMQCVTLSNRSPHRTFNQHTCRGGCSTQLQDKQQCVGVACYSTPQNQSWRWLLTIPFSHLSLRVRSIMVSAVSHMLYQDLTTSGASTYLTLIILSPHFIPGDFKTSLVIHPHFILEGLWTTFSYFVPFLNNQPRRTLNHFPYFVQQPIHKNLMAYSTNSRQLWASEISACCIKSYVLYQELREVPVVFGRCPWYNGYRRRIWTRRYEFRSWMRLITFHVALIPLGKVWIQLFSLKLWVNSRAD